VACLNSDGSLTVVAAAILASLGSVSDPADVAAATSLPLYRVRAGLRELAAAGFVELVGERYESTESGTAALRGSQRTG
jgi:hypothetical protein